MNALVDLVHRLARLGEDLPAVAELDQPGPGHARGLRRGRRARARGRR